jgi:preprotein translocase SecE subunit
MATEEEDSKSTPPTAGDAVLATAGAGDTEQVEFDGGVPTDLGTTKYVHAAFFAFGVLVTYLAGKLLASAWNMLAEWPAAVRAVPQLLRYAEDERPSFTMVAGAVIGIVTVVRMLRNPDTRQWADEVAGELYKVVWPDRDTVTHGTIVVLVAGVFATVYIGLLDRLWNFITNLVYGI